MKNVIVLVLILTACGGSEETIIELTDFGYKDTK